MSLLQSSSLVLGMDPREITAARRGDEHAGDFSDAAIARLASEIERLREIKRSRMEKLQDLVASMLELWNLMDTPAEEQRRFQGVACNIAVSEDEIPDGLRDGVGGEAAARWGGGPAVRWRLAGGVGASGRWRASGSASGEKTGERRGPLVRWIEALFSQLGWSTPLIWPSKFLKLALKMKYRGPFLISPLELLLRTLLL